MTILCRDKNLYGWTTGLHFASIQGGGVIFAW